MKFGMIPEFLGRLPVTCALEQLSEDALIEILTKPKNAIVKQFQHLFNYENVELKFTDGALRAVVQEAIRRKTGARGLRSILEGNMLDVMYEMPSQNDLKEVVVTEECILSAAEPVLVYRTEEEKQAAAVAAKEAEAKAAAAGGPAE